MVVAYLTIDQVVELPARAIHEFGGEAGLRSTELLASAVLTPQQSAFGTDAYPTIPEKAAAYAVSLTLNHPFLDGNKRTAAAAMLVFLDINGYELPLTDDDIATMVEGLAQPDLEPDAFRRWLEQHARPIASALRERAE